MEEYSGLKYLQSTDNANNKPPKSPSCVAPLPCELQEQLEILTKSEALQCFEALLPLLYIHS